MSQGEFTAELLEACRARGVNTAIDTSGFAPWDALAATIPLTDLYLFDIKHMDPEKHKKYTGVDNAVILSNFAKLGEAGARINARMPFLPGINTDEANLIATGDFLSRARGVEALNLLPYHTAAEDKHDRWGMEFKLRGLYPPTENALASAAGVIESRGVKVVIGG